MNNITISMLIVVGFFAIAFYMSQQKFKDKMLCTFIRPNKQKIEKWVPLDSKQIVFDRGRYGIGRYNVISDCITMMWFTRGINKFFPILIPTLDYRWNSINPVNPATGEVTWMTPEAQQAGWEEHQHVAFAKGTQAATGKRSKFPEWLFPLITAGLIAIVLFIVWQGMSGLDQRMWELEQQLKLLLP